MTYLELVPYCSDHGELDYTANEVDGDALTCPACGCTWPTNAEDGDDGTPRETS